MPHHVAGTEVYTWALAKSLQQKGNDVTILVPDYNSDILNEYKYDGLSVKRYPEPDKRDRLLMMGKRAPNGIDAFKQLIIELQPDIVHVQELAGSSGIGIYHLRALKKMGIRTVFTMHLARYSCFCGTLMYKDKESCTGLIDIKRCTQCALSKLPINNTAQKILYNASMPLYNLNIDTAKLNNSIGTAFSYPFIIKKLRISLFEIFDLCSKVIVLTDWYKEVLLENGVPANKISVIKQALPYNTHISEVQIVKAGPSVSLIFIGRIDPIKGLHLLIDAIINLPEDKIVLHLYGAVNDEAYFINLKNKTNGKKNIVWKGVLAQKDVVATMRDYDALILPSMFSEMSPLVIQEAFAAGIPVIGSNVYGIAEQIQDGVNGLLFQFGDALALKKTLQKLINNPELLNKLSENIKPVDGFKRVADETENVYKSVLAV
jgi:glycosyltransferase involved in cell wall biosynthesis